jgi:hypothetical protein
MHKFFPSLIFILPTVAKEVDPQLVAAAAEKQAECGYASGVLGEETDRVFHVPRRTRTAI